VSILTAVNALETALYRLEDELDRNPRRFDDGAHVAGVLRRVRRRFETDTRRKIDRALGFERARST
jgi:hypothetical protein